MCIVVVKRLRVLSRRAGWSRGHSPSDCPAARQLPNILLIKSNLKFESRATAVSVAMSPRYLGGKYWSRLHPWSRKCACLILRETGRVKSSCARPASSASHGNNEVDHAVCLKAKFQMHTALSNENGKFYTTMIYPCFSRSLCFSMGSPAWWRFGLFQAGVPSCPGDVTLRSCTREFQMWRRRCKQMDPHWFHWRQMRFWWMLSTMLWK